MNGEAFKNEYDTQLFQKLTPNKRTFEMLAAPRLVNVYKEHENFTADLLLNYAKEDTLFIDIGAHYGFFTLLVGTRYKNSKILSFEPVPENFSVLKKNLELNGLTNIEAYNLAVSDTTGVRKFNISEASDNCGFDKHPAVKTLRVIDVNTVTLDNFLPAAPKLPTIVKIDTDGHEIKMLAGMRNLLKNTEDIKLFIEFNPKCLRNAGHQPEDLLIMLQQLGFDIYFINEEQRETYKLKENELKHWDGYFDEGISTKKTINILGTKKQKSLSVCFFSHSSQLAGAERSLLSLVEGLVREYGVLCTVVLPDDGPLREKLEQAGASALIINYSWWCDSSPLPPQEINERMFHSLKSVMEGIRQKLEQINPDVIVSYTMVIPWGALAASLLGKPHIWSIQEFGDNFEFFLPFSRILEIIKDSSNVVVTNSQAVRNRLFGKEHKENILTVSYHIDIPSDALYPDNNNYFTNKKAAKLTLLGTINENKGQKDALLAVTELIQRKREVELVMVGYQADAIYLENLKKMIAENNLEAAVKLLDFKENVYPLMNQADILLSCSRSESFGRTMVEAMLLKKPVIATEVGGAVELIREGHNGLFYQPGDYKQLADKIEYFMEHPEKIKEFGEKGYQFVKDNFTAEGYQGKIYNLLLKIKNDANPVSAPFVRFVMENMEEVILRDERRQKEQVIARLEKEINERDAHISNLEIHLNNIYKSHGYRLLHIYYRLLDKLLPVETRKRTWAKLLFRRSEEKP